MIIREYAREDMAAVIALWNGCAERGETLYRRMTADYFNEKFISGEHCEGRLLLVAQCGAVDCGAAKGVCGFIAGCRRLAFLPGQTHENTPGYITVILVDPACRRRGIGGQLLAALECRFRALGKTKAAVSSLNPVNLDWVIPGTPNHEHNNAPGADEAGMGYPFFQKHGYIPRAHEVAMYLNLSDYVKSPKAEQKRAELLSRGVEAGLYDLRRGCEFDTMCDRVGSEYWRQVLREESRRDSPRPVLAAVANGRVVGFTGPVDVQENGRGWFTGICTDPDYERMGIATVLFNDLMAQFIKVGAAYSTLFTGVENHAQRLYINTGFRPARHFAILNKTLEV